MDSKTIFELRNEAKDLSGIEKLNKLNNALGIARNLYSEEPYDEWIQKAFAWVLIDLCKHHITNKNLNQAETSFNELNTIDFQGNEDEIIEKQKNFLRPKIDTNYSEIQKAEELSKNGKNQEALTIFKNLISQSRLTELHHESYGWVIYRYIKAEESKLSSVEVRTFLRDYMNLKNERPSMLHSMILNFGLHYSKDHFDFNLYNFFKLWNPSNLRSEDKENQDFNDKEIPSLISRIFREFNDKDLSIDIDYLIEKIDIRSWNSSLSSNQQVLDLLREPFFWKLFNANKENKQAELWHIFNKYNQAFSKYEKSKWHSKILGIAERYMKETEEWRFLEFFKNWNPENLLDEDWEEVKKDDKLYKPLAIKCLKKAFNIIKTQNKEFSENWLLPSYSKAVKLFSDDEWLLRENALLLIKSNELESAIEIYRKLVLELGDKSYIWNEFSSCFNTDKDLKIGMLSKAIQLEKNEDFLGDIHLELAKTLFENGLIENCVVELDLYKRNRELKGWRLSELFIEISNKTKNQNTYLKDNKSIYEKYIPIAEQYAYKQIEWTELILVDNWKNDKGKDRIAFTNGKTIDLSIGSRRFTQLKQSSLGNIYKFKLHKQEIKKEVEGKYSWMGKTTITECKYIPLIVEKSDKADWSILDDICAIVDYINIEKKIIHAITADNKEVFFPQDKIQLQIGDFIKAKYFTKKIKDEIRIDLKNIEKIDKAIGIINFSKIIAVIDGVNREKNLFHYVGSTTVQGVIRFAETSIIPEEGKFLEIYFASKKDKKHNKTIFKAIEIRETTETNPNLIKSINGHLKLKYKRGGSTFDLYDLDLGEIGNILPDFGFVGDFYVPKKVLESENITYNCDVIAKAINNNGKWQVFKIEKESYKTLLIKKINKETKEIPLINEKWWTNLSKEWKEIFLFNIEFQSKKSNYNYYINKNNEQNFEHNFKLKYIKPEEFNLEENLLILNGLKALYIDGDIPILEQICFLRNLEEIYLRNNTQNLLPLNQLHKLKAISFFNNSSFLSDLSSIISLTKISLAGKSAYIEKLIDIPQLTILDLEIRNPEDVNIISSLVNLKELSLSGSIENIGSFNNLSLKKLNLTGTKINLAPYANLTSLEELKLTGNETNLTPISGILSLKKLFIDVNYPDISSISQFENLENLLLSGCKSDLKPISKLKKLKKLELWLNKMDLTPISYLSNLEELELVDNEADLTPISNLKNLNNLWIDFKKVNY